MANIEKTLALRKCTDLATKVLVKYYRNLKAFSQTEVDKLPKH